MADGFYLYELLCLNNKKPDASFLSPDLISPAGSEASLLNLLYTQLLWVSLSKMQSRLPQMHSEKEQPYQSYFSLTLESTSTSQQYHGVFLMHHNPSLLLQRGPFNTQGLPMALPAQLFP